MHMLLRVTVPLCACGYNIHMDRMKYRYVYTGALIWKLFILSSVRYANYIDHNRVQSRTLIVHGTIYAYTAIKVPMGVTIIQVLCRFQTFWCTDSNLCAHLTGTSFHCSSSLLSPLLVQAGFPSAPQDMNLQDNQSPSLCVCACVCMRVGVCVCVCVFVCECIY